MFKKWKQFFLTCFFVSQTNNIKKLGIKNENFFKQKLFFDTVFDDKKPDIFIFRKNYLI